MTRAMGNFFALSVSQESLLNELCDKRHIAFDVKNKSAQFLLSSGCGLCCENRLWATAKAYELQQQIRRKVCYE